MKRMSPLEFTTNFVLLMLVMAFLVALDWSEKTATALARQIRLTGAAVRHVLARIAGVPIYWGAWVLSTVDRCTGRRCSNCANCYRISYAHSARH